MSTTNTTANFNLPQWAAGDLTSWMGDLNPAFETIDSALQENKTMAAAANQTAAQASAKADTASQQAQNAANLANSATENIQNIKNNWQSQTVPVTVVYGGTVSETQNTLSISYNQTLKLLQIGGLVTVLPNSESIKLSFSLPQFVQTDSSKMTIWGGVTSLNNGIVKGTAEVLTISIQNNICNVTGYTATVSTNRDFFFSWCGMFPFINIINPQS